MARCDYGWLHAERPSTDVLAGSGRERPPAVRANAGAEVVVAVEMPFADVGRLVSAVAEALAHRPDVVSQGQIVGPGPGGVGIKAGEHAGPRWGTKGAGGIGPGEQDAGFSQMVDVGQSPYFVLVMLGTVIEVSSSLTVQIWSVKPAAKAGERGCQRRH